MSLLLSISDNGDGSGGVATVTGTSGAPVTVYAAAFMGALGSLQWIAAGSQMGDGPLAVNPGQGFFLWQAQTATAVSNAVYQNLTNSTTQSVHYRCLLAAQTQVQALNLVPMQQVTVRWLPRHWETIDPLPQVAIVPMGSEGQPGILTGRDDIELPVLIAVIDKQNMDFTTNLSRNLLWRQQIFRTFRNQRLPGVIEVITTSVQPNAVVDASLFNKSYMYSGLLCKFRSREVRGFPGI